MAGCAAAYAQTEDRDRAEIVANEHAWSASFTTGDASRAERFLADEFVGTDEHGVHTTKSGELASIRSSPHAVRTEIESVTVRFFGDAAIAEVHEHDTGPAPGMRPMHNVATDVWVRRDGRWQAVSGVDLDTGFATPERFAGDVEAIGKLRAENNAALARHDVEGFAKLFDESALFVWSDGSTAVGRAGLKKDFAERFKDANLKTYVRTPQEIRVAEDGARAVEQGRWTGLLGDRVTGGDYTAHWTRTATGWTVRGELYVRLYCTGAGCGR